MAAQPARYDAQQRELAYRVWKESAQNMAETLRRLDKDYEWPLAKQTLQDWRDGGGWVARAAAEEQEERRRERAAALDRMTMLGNLDLAIERYQDAITAMSASGEIPDPRAVAAWANLMRLRLSTLKDIESGAGLSKLDLAMDTLHAVSDMVREEYPQHSAAWLELIEPAGRRLAGLYG